MSASKRIPEAEGLDVVVVGAFNPAIFHPDWFLRQSIIGEQDAKDAKDEKMLVVSREVTEVHLGGIKVACIPDRLSLGISNISQSARLYDVLVQIFTQLSHIPVSACGINLFAHYLAGSPEYWHKIGHTLAPKDLVWNELLHKPGMQSLTIKGVRDGDFAGEINVTVEPSARYSPGIYVRSNYHYPLPENTAHGDASKLLLQFLRSEWEPACAMAKRVAEQIFDKIKPDL
jgi:hypothetical protein